MQRRAALLVGQHAARAQHQEQAYRVCRDSTHSPLVNPHSRSHSCQPPGAVQRRSAWRELRRAPAKPLYAAQCSGVRPSLSSESVSAFHFRARWYRTAVWPYCAATWHAV